MKKLILASVISAFLVGCGGGSGGGSSVDSTPNKPTTGSESGSDNGDSNNGGSNNGTTPENKTVKQGIYSGQTALGQEAVGLITDNNHLWFLYSSAYKDNIDGLITGKFESGQSNFTADVKDYNVSTSTVYPATLKSKVNSENSLTGNIDYGRSDSVDFNLEYQKSLSNVRVAPIDLGTKAFKGNVGITNIGVESAGITTSIDGKFIGIGESGCEINGQLSKSKAGNYLNVDITFGGSPCGLPNQKFKGISYFDKENKSITVTAVDSTGDYGLLYQGKVVVDGAGEFIDILNEDLSNSKLNNDLSKPIDKIN